MAFLRTALLVVLVSAAAAKTCTQDSDCSASPYGGKCEGTSSKMCNCASGFSKVSNDCKETPKKPVLTVVTTTSQTTTPPGDLTPGVAYTLVCTSTTTSLDATEFYKGTTKLSSADLGAVTNTNNGDHTCKVTKEGAESTSDKITIKLTAYGKRCAVAGDCTGNEYSGTCTSSRCVCSANHIPVGEACVSNMKTCTADTDCSTAPFAAPCKTGTGTRYCSCATAYEESGNNCKVKLTKPTLTIPGAVLTSLSLGAMYEFKCESANAPVNTMYKYYKGTADAMSKIAEAKTSDDGSYTCEGSLDGVMSGKSDAVTIAVKDAGKYCTPSTVTADCVGKMFEQKCNSNRCDCADGYKKSKDTCVSGAARLTSVSLLAVLVTMIMSKLL